MKRAEKRAARAREGAVLVPVSFYNLGATNKRVCVHHDLATVALSYVPLPVGTACGYKNCEHVVTRRGWQAPDGLEQLTAAVTP